MKVFNTLTGAKQTLAPLDGESFKIYACGPTVYNLIHIGNARMVVVFDTLRRYLAYRGYKVKFVQNYTDVDDKMIRRAAEEHTTVAAVAEKYIAEYETDARGLNLLPADVHPRATQNIDEIISIISALIEKGHAYAAGGDVYFRARSFRGYGKLSHQPLSDLEAGARIDVNECKEDPMDFALWKAEKPGEPSWDSPWGKGRPGWHIECSAMARKYLGKTIDIHCGGQDLIFPHHENEIAQSECANGCEFARYWMHNGYLNIDNRKMSKSLGNFFTVRDVAQKFGYEPIRFLMISAHYRTPINYSLEIMEQTVSALNRLRTCRRNLGFLFAPGAENAPLGPADEEALQSRGQQFIDAMDDDLNTADALAAVFELVRDINTRTAPGANASEAYAARAAGLLDELCGVLGLTLAQAEDEIPEDVKALAEQRQQARKSRDFKTADRIRDELAARGFTLEDGPQGVKILPKK